MLEVRCTKKLCNLLELSIDQHSISREETTVLGVWYGNIFNVEYDPYLYDKDPES